MIETDIIIIGGGFAGAAAAWHLSEAGLKDVILLEREDLPGMHASSQNASMLRQFEEDEVIARCAFRGAGFILTPPYNWGKIVDQVGSLLLIRKSRLPSIMASLVRLLKIGLEAEIISKKEAIDRVPILETADFDAAVWTATDGVVDINALLTSYLKDAKQNGARVVCRQAVMSIREMKNRTFVVTTENATYEACRVVNAAGAWAAEIGRLAGAVDIPLTPFRRHLYNTTFMKNVDPKWPFVWDTDHQYYFRPESGGLLLSPCDEEPASPGVPSTSHLMREMLAEKLERFCPSLADITIGTEWAGLRTFAPDRRFVIGRDPVLQNFCWVAGLGGQGVTCSFEVGRLAADAVLHEGKIIPDEFRPDRFTPLTPRAQPA